MDYLNLTIKCYYCDYRAWVDSSLRSHISRKHRQQHRDFRLEQLVAKSKKPRQPFNERCSGCRRSFKRKYHLKRHE